MKLPLALLLLIAIVLPAGAAAQPGAGPDLFEPGAPPPAPPATLAAAPAQPGDACYPLLADPKVDIAPAGTPWREYRAERLFSTATFFSGPRSLHLRADADGDPVSGPDVDAIGQELVITATLTALRGSLYYQYAAGTPRDGDRLLVELYEADTIDPSGLLATAVELTATGRVEGEWQYLSWEVTDPTVLSQLKVLGRAALVFTMVSEGSPGTARLWLDDLSAERCAAATNITGQVTRGGAAAPEALVTLLATTAAGTSVVAQTRTIADGTYEFSSVPPQPAGTTYRVWFLNRPATPPRQGGQLGFWAGPRLPQLEAGESVSLPAFEVADVALQSPASYAEVVATNTTPAVLRWGGRAPRPGERHRLCLYDPARADQATGLPAQLCGPLVDPSKGETLFRLAPSSFGGAPAFGFRYDRPYRWYVVVYAGDPTASPDVPYGYSFGERAITLLGAPRAGTTTPPAPEPGDPAPGAAGADWTLLIYMAADNAIGDARRAPSVGRPSGQLASLPALARAYPGVRLVSYVDRYGPGGAEVCAYPAGAEPDCRARAEVDSADPRTLAGFISFGRARYPAARTALLIVAPGQAAGELAIDETTPGAPSMSLAGLQAAYGAAGLGGATRLDLVVYQAPLLGSAEVLRATAPYARYMVASPELVWQLGPYRELVPLMAGASKGDAAAVARGAVSAYARTVAAAGGGRANVWAAYDLGRAGALDEALNAAPGGLAFEILGYLNASQATVTRRALGEARAAAQSYDSSGNGRHDGLATATGAVAAEEDALVDARDLGRAIQATAGMPDSIKAAAGRLGALLDTPASSPVIAYAARSGQSVGGAQVDLARSRGLALFFPSGDRLGGQPALAETALYGSLLEQPGDSLWADMARTYLAGAPGAGPGGVTEGAGGGAQFRPLPGGFVGNPLYLPFVGR